MKREGKRAPASASPQPPIVDQWPVDYNQLPERLANVAAIVARIVATSSDPNATVDDLIQLLTLAGTDDHATKNRIFARLRLSAYRPGFEERLDLFCKRTEEMYVEEFGLPEDQDVQRGKRRRRSARPRQVKSAIKS